MLSYEQARANRLTTEWDDHEIASPWFLGRRALEVPLGELLPFIDWTPLFPVWALNGRYPGILDHPEYGPAARELHAQATTLLDRIVAEKLLSARGVYGFWPANSDDDDIVVFENDDRRKERLRLPMLRQQQILADGEPNRSLADFIAPRRSGVPDYLGMFVVTAGIGAEELARRFEQAHDGRSAVVARALADRLAAAFAEYLHAQAGRDWGYGERAQRSVNHLASAQSRGIRPECGGPACPDRSERFKLFDTLRAPEQGITLSGHAAMLPAASVGGLYFSHPQARNFDVGRIGLDQAGSYAARKAVPLEEVERWLAPHLSYDPSAQAPAGGGGGIDVR